MACGHTSNLQFEISNFHFSIAAKGRAVIIPFFIPHAGCPHQCVFCNQKSITGQDRPADTASIPETISAYLKSTRTVGPVQIAFYGGSFTALPLNTQKDYLASVQPFIQSGQVESVRLSTRPDSVTGEILSLLKAYQVTTVELGVQSMDDRVLTLSGRGHTAADTVHAVGLLRENGFQVGLQLMPGLPGDSADRFQDTINTIIGLKPDFVRLYPALVIKGTPLEKLYTTGLYSPLPLDDAVFICRRALVACEQAGIKVIRIGLQSTKELERNGAILAGPYHPAFRQLVESSLLLDTMRQALKNRRDSSASVVFQVSPKDVSAAIGNLQSNVRTLKKEFGLRTIKVVAGRNTLQRGELTCLSFF